jgi:phenylpropionate dioxygenase-like ring-hydroxylating dioxygenase large terminal subunit
MSWLAQPIKVKAHGRSIAAHFMSAFFHDWGYDNVGQCIVRAHMTT